MRCLILKKRKFSRCVYNHWLKLQSCDTLSRAGIFIERAGNELFVSANADSLFVLGKTVFGIGFAGENAASLTLYFDLKKSRSSI